MSTNDVLGRTQCGIGASSAIGVKQLRAHVRSINTLMPTDPGNTPQFSMAVGRQYSKSDSYSIPYPRTP